MIDITWLGHSGFRIASGNHVLLVDPWLRGNPVFDETRIDEATQGATHILVTHAHADHAADVPEIAKATGAEVIGIYDYMGFLEADGVEKTLGLNKGGTLDLGGGVTVTMVHAIHSSTMSVEGRTIHPGSEAGYMIGIDGRTIYFAGDTDVMADMQIFQDLHAPEIGILPIGGRFTMDAHRAAYACNTFFDFTTIIPCHFGTFPVLAPDAEVFREQVARGDVRVPVVMEALSL